MAERDHNSEDELGYLDFVPNYQAIQENLPTSRQKELYGKLEGLI